MATFKCKNQIKAFNAASEKMLNEARLSGMLVAEEWEDRGFKCFEARRPIDQSWQGTYSTIAACVGCFNPMMRYTFDHVPYGPKKIYEDVYVQE